MSTSLLRVVERAQQDAEQGPEAIQSNGLRRVSAPPTPTGRGPARSAHETLGRTLQLLRSERQPSKFGPSGSRHATGLAKMAAPSQPAHASHVGAVQPIVGTLPASPPAGCRADMGGVATRHISGGAGWWKSPCPDLVRASGEQSPGATRSPPPASARPSQLCSSFAGVLRALPAWRSRSSAVRVRGCTSHSCCCLRCVARCGPVVRHHCRPQAPWWAHPRYPSAGRRRLHCCVYHGPARCWASCLAVLS